MELQKQVVSLELAKRLKELGVKQQSYFSHVSFSNEMGDECQEIYTNDDMEREYAADWHEQYAAFTVAELGEILLAEEYNSPWYDIDEKCWKWDDYIGYPVVKIVRTIEDADTEADARGRMLEYLAVNKLIEL